MSDYNEQVQIPSDFFTKSLKEYQDWRVAWFRETIQNAMDAKATRIDFTIKKTKQSIQVTVTDNGCGMDRATLLKGFLTLGGSNKEKNNDCSPIGGFGYAKHIILFAHQSYQICTQDYIVTGQGNHYSMEKAGRNITGTRITVTLNPSENIQVLKQCCREFVKNTQTAIPITLNKKHLPTNTQSYSYHTDTVLGPLHFSEPIRQRDMNLWVRIQGLPMFRYALNDTIQKGLVGILDLDGKPTELLTANRENFNHQYAPRFEQLISDLLYQREQFKPNNDIILILNPSDNLIARQQRDKKVVSLFSYYLRVIVPQEKETLPQLTQTKRLKSVLERLEQVTNVLIYPDNFFLSYNVDNQSLKSYTSIKKLLNLQTIQKLAWCWHYAIHWIIETDAFQAFFQVQYDKQDNTVLVDKLDKQKRYLFIGFTFDKGKEGLNWKSQRDFRILMNPNFFDLDWLVSDVIDLAIHECAHCIEPNHGEYFSDIELQIRRELRRLVDDAEILTDAETIISDVRRAISAD